MREMVRLGAGVGPDGRLDKQVAARALMCLERFGQRLRDMHARSVRVVGTNALRISRRKQAFLERAREALGHPIEIVSGMEEARLIYSGVAHTLPAEPGHRLVIDIGGGSTEVVIGEGYEPQLLASLKLGCVSMSRQVFRRRATLAQALRACAARRARGNRADADVLPAARLGAGGWQFGNRAGDRRLPARTQSAGDRRHRRGSRGSAGRPQARRRLPRAGAQRAYRRTPAGVSGRRGDPGGTVRGARHRAAAHGRGRAARRAAV